MTNKYNDIDLLERYIDGTANHEERLKVEELFNSNPGLQEEYGYFKLAVSSVKLAALHKQVGNIAKIYHNKNQQPAFFSNGQTAKVRSIGFYALRAAAVITIVLASYTAIQYASVTPDTLYSESFVDYNLPATRNGVKAVNTDMLYKMEKWEAVLDGVTKESSPKERFLAGMSALHLNKPGIATAYFEEIINTSPEEKIFTQESEFYLSLACIKTKNYSKAISLINKIKQNPDHPYYKQSRKISLFKATLLNLK